MKPFLIKIRPTVPLTEVLLVRPKSLTKGDGDPFFIEGKYFYQKVNIFYTKNSTIPTHPTRIMLSNCLDWQFLPFSNQRWLLPLVLIDNHGWHISSICFGLAMTPLSIHLDWLFLFLGNHRRNLFPFTIFFSRGWEGSSLLNFINGREVKYIVSSKYIMVEPPLLPSESKSCTRCHNFINRLEWSLDVQLWLPLDP